MTSCIFHDSSPATRERQVFELAEQAYNQRRKVVIFVRDEARAIALDRALWIVKQEAFMPHRIFGANEADPDIRIAIVTNEMNPIAADVLIADGQCKLEFACEFDSIHEFVDRSTPEIHQACRDRFREYRARQVPVDYAK
jgi:DNA polymerase IIIc chi subunit